MKQKSLSASLEDYLEAIYQISRGATTAPANKIAAHLGVGKSSVSWAMNQLSEKGLIHYAPYEAISLTNRGLQQARQIAGRHQQIQQFLEHVLGLESGQAEANACRMEHVVDPEILDRMKQFMLYLESHPRQCGQFLNAYRHFVTNHSSAVDSPPPEPSPRVPKVSKDRDQTILERLLLILHEAGICPGPTEQAVMEAFMATERHQNLTQIQELADHRGVKTDIRTVERVMNMLCEYKIARAMRFRDQLLYEHYHPESHHDHLFCVKCGTIVEFYDPQLESLQKDNADTAEFRILTHSLDIYGVCRNCLHREAQVRELADCLAGEVIEVVRIAGDEAMQRRMTQMGLTPGAAAEVLSDHCPGQSVIVMAGTTRLMLDGELARKIWVAPAAQPGWPGQHRRRHHHGEETM